MRKFILFFLAFCLTAGNAVYSQSGLLNRVARSVTNDLLGQPDSKMDEPEPDCANDQASLAFDLNGKFKVDYNELNINVLDDGRIKVQAQGSDDNYVAKDGIVQGPYKAGDPRLTDFETSNEDDDNMESLIAKNKPFISRTGEKYLITFDGKKYGPYADIPEFTVSKSKNKFVAIVVENVPATENQASKMAEAMENAKSDQERVELAMKWSEQISSVDPMSVMPKMISNIPGATYNPLESGGEIRGDLTYDNILVLKYDVVINLQGKTVLTLKSEATGNDKKLFINTSNTKYAYFKYGTLTFSDNTKLSNLFNPVLRNEGGKDYISYMYYSPKKNSIMQWKIPL
jgi:hypothetical protein